MDGLFTKTTAKFSGCGSYRYALEREWDPARGRVCWILLNPSRANAHADDPTLTRCRRFTMNWGYGALSVVNLFALVSTDPSALRLHPHPVGRRNDEHLIKHADAADRIVCAWGAHGTYLDRDVHVTWRLRKHELWCLGTTKAGRPLHPLRIPYSAPLVPFWSSPEKKT